MAKELIRPFSKDPNIIAVQPNAYEITTRPQLIKIYFGVQVRDVSVSSSISTTQILKEAITITEMPIAMYEHYFYQALGPMPYSLYKNIHEVKFDYYFTDQHLAYLTVAYEKNITDCLHCPNCIITDDGTYAATCSQTSKVLSTNRYAKTITIPTDDDPPACPYLEDDGSAWISTSVQLRFTNCVPKQIYEFDLTLPSEDMI